MSASDPLIERLTRCAPGRNGWKEFEDSCLAILEYLFVPPLRPPRIQARSYSGIDRRDAIFSNRDFDAYNSWGKLFQELQARMILFEFKNYDNSEIGKEEVDQARNYMTEPMGRLAILCCNKKPNEAAHIRRNTIFGTERKVLLFLSIDHLKEMCFIKERGEDPADLIIDLVEEFYIQHE
jgi:hypothetical protein